MVYLQVLREGERLRPPAEVLDGPKERQRDGWALLVPRRARKLRARLDQADRLPVNVIDLMSDEW